MMSSFWDFNIGNFLTILAFITGGLGFVYTIKGQVESITHRMLEVETELKKLVEVLIEQGRHSERLNAIDARLNVISERIATLDGDLRKVRA